MTTVRSLLIAADAELAATSSTPRLDAELLLAHVLGWSRARVVAESRFVLPPEAEAAFRALLERRKALEPVAYLVGAREFFRLRFAVDRRVLIPRPETELLVELALAWARARGGALTVADIGTGSGAIAVALAVHLPEAQISAIDLSGDALAVAHSNATAHGVAERIGFLQGDLLEPLRAPVDLLVSNPPYTHFDEIEEGVRRYEPRLALDGGPDSLSYYRRLAAATPAYLRHGGGLFFEIGAWQGAAVAELLAAALPRHQIAVRPDLSGRDRVVSALP